MFKQWVVKDIAIVLYRSTLRGMAIEFLLTVGIMETCGTASDATDMVKLTMNYKLFNVHTELNVLVLISKLITADILLITCSFYQFEVGFQFEVLHGFK